MLGDFLLDSALAGLFATALGTIVDYLIFMLGKQENHIIQYCAAIMLPEEMGGVTSLSAKTTGLLGHLVVGGIFGINISLVLHLSGPAYAYVKGMGISAAYWALLHQSLTAKFWVSPKHNISPSAVLWQLGIHLFEGFTAAALLIRTVYT